MIRLESWMDQADTQVNGAEQGSARQLQEPIAVNINQAAVLLGVSENTLRTWLSTGAMQGVSYMVGKRRFFDVSALKAWSYEQAKASA